jgi:hypothetical protein
LIVVHLLLFYFSVLLEKASFFIFGVIIYLTNQTACRRRRTRMKTKITDTAKVIESLNEGQGKATARTLTPHDIEQLAAYGEKRLEELGLAKHYRVGAKAFYSPPRVPNSYKYRAEGTYATITRGSSAWYLTEVRRADTGSQSYGGSARHAIRLTAAQQIQLINNSELYSDVVALPNSVFDPWTLTRLKTEPKLRTDTEKLLSFLQVTEKEPTKQEAGSL